MRIKKRLLGAGAAIAIALVTALPGPAGADPGHPGIDSATDPATDPAIDAGGPWVGTDAWRPSFPYRHRWVHPGTSPGRWGGYRGRITQPPTIEPPVYDESNGYPTTQPSATETSPAVSPTEPGPPAAPTPSDPVQSGAPSPTGPTEPGAPAPTPSDSVVPTGAPGTPAPTYPAPTYPAPTYPVPTGTLPVPTSTAPSGIPIRSGLPWASGVYARGQGAAGLAAFGNWRGRATDVVVDWPARQTWNDIVNPDWLYRTWQGTPETKVFGVAPIPEGDASASLAGCAAGSYNDKWRQYGENIKAAGLDDETIVRLGWEFNGDWYKWQARDPGQFAECWRQIVGTVEQVAPALRWDWNPNRGRGQSVPDARLAYPGDAYVDFVGLDSYDMWPPARDEASWQVHYSGEFGLKFWSDFAAEHGKKFSVAEWGVYPGPASSGHGGGDNPFYIAKMMEFFRSLGGNLAYEAYFNESAAYYAGAIFSPAQAPAAAAQYQRAIAP